MSGLKCELCGFQFSGPGEFRNCEAFVTEHGATGVICPTCGANYVRETKEPPNIRGWYLTKRGTLKEKEKEKNWRCRSCSWKGPKPEPDSRGDIRCPQCGCVLPGWVVKEKSSPKHGCSSCVEKEHWNKQCSCSKEEEKEKNEGGEPECCGRCEGSGLLYADGKPHFMRERAAVIPCSECGGSGTLKAPAGEKKGKV